MQGKRVHRYHGFRKTVELGIVLVLLLPGIVPSLGENGQKTPFPILSMSDILYVGGGGVGNFSKIQDAIDTASAGDTIYVYYTSSPYFEHVVIEKSVTLVGEETFYPEINGSSLDSSLDTILVLADDVTIQGFCITTNPGYYYQAAVKIESRNISILDCYITGNEWVGISLLNASSCHIEDCELFNNLIAIHLVNSKNNVIQDCLCHDNADGITLYQSSDGNQLLNNWCARNRFDGILIQQSSGNHIISCVCENGYSGISLPYAPGTFMRNTSLVNNYVNFGIGSSSVSDFYCDIDTSNTINGKPLFFLIDQHDLIFDENTEIGFLGLIQCQNISVRNQFFSQNFQGVLLAGTTDSLFENCSFRNNDGHGLYMISSQNITIQSCSFRDGFWDGIFLYDCSNNVFNDCSCQNSITGMILGMSHQNVVQQLTIQDCDVGIKFDSSSGNLLRDNVMLQCGVQVFGINAAEYENDVDTSNTVNGNPVYYLINQTNITIPLDAGQVILARCTGCVVSHCSLSNASIGVELAYSSKNIIEHNVLADNSVVAIDLDGSDNEGNIIRQNLLQRNNYGVDVDSSDLNVFQENTLIQNGMGFAFDASWRNTLIGNIIQDGSYGVYLVSSSENTFTGNLVCNLSLFGMYLLFSCLNVLDSNTMMNCGLMVYGNDVKEYRNDVDTTNTVNGKPVYYLSSQQHVTIPSDAGEVILVDSENCTIKDLQLNRGTIGVLLAYSSHNIIQGNLIRNQSICALDLSSGYNDDNIILGNIVQENANGMVFFSSKGNIIRKNKVLSNGEGIILGNTLTTFISRNTISRNNYGIVVSHANESRIFFNNIYQNYAYGLIVEACAVNARWNWWGAVSGPGTDGNGDCFQIVEKGQILYAPWLWFPVLFTGNLRFWLLPELKNPMVPGEIAGGPTFMKSAPANQYRPDVSGLRIIPEEPHHHGQKTIRTPDVIPDFPFFLLRK